MSREVKMVPVLPGRRGAMRWRRGFYLPTSPVHVLLVVPRQQADLMWDSAVVKYLVGCPVSKQAQQQSKASSGEWSINRGFGQGSNKSDPERATLATSEHPVATVVNSRRRSSRRLRPM